MMVNRFGSGGGFRSNVGGGRGGRGARNSTFGESSNSSFPSGVNGHENFARSQKYDSLSFQQRGHSNRGDQVQYHHDDKHARSRGVVSNSDSGPKICRYYQEGNCRYGEDCRFRHVNPGQQPSRSGNSRGDRGRQGKGDVSAIGTFGHERGNREGYTDSRAFGSTTRVSARQGVGVGGFGSGGGFGASSPGIEFNASGGATVAGGFLSSSLSPTPSFSFRNGDGASSNGRGNDTVSFHTGPDTAVSGGFLSSTPSLGQEQNGSFDGSFKDSAPFGIRVVTTGIGNTLPASPVAPVPATRDGSATSEAPMPFGNAGRTAVRHGNSAPVLLASAPVHPTPSVQDVWYSDESSISPEDLKAHETRNFRLGAIPEDPPPRRFCGRT